MNRFHILIFTIASLVLPLNSYANSDTDEVIIATPIVRVTPELPKGMKPHKIQEGFVTIHFEITETGLVENPVVVESKPENLYDEVSLAAIKKFRFKPHMVNGKAMRFKGSQTILFEGKNDRKFDAGYDLSEYKTDELSFHLDRFQKDHDYKSTMVITEKATEKTIKKIIMPDSDVDWGLMSGTATSPYVFYYHSTSKKKAKIKVYTRLGMELLHDIDVEHASQVKAGSNYEIFFTHKNDNQLMALVGKKEPKLITIDGSSGVLQEYDIPFEKNTLAIASNDGRYIWARKLSTVFGKVIKTEMKIIDTDGFKVIKTIPISTKIDSIYYLDGILEITFVYETEDLLFRRMFLRLSDQEYIGDFKVIKKASYAYDVGENNAWLVMGIAEDGEHLKVGKLEKGEFNILTEDEFEIDYNLIQVDRTEGKEGLLVYGNKKFIKYDINNPENSIELAAPFNVAAAYTDANLTKFYLTEQNGPKVALADMVEKKIIATDRSQFGGLKTGLHQNQLKKLSIEVPSNYDTSFAGKSFSNTDNILILNNHIDRLFVLRINSSYITSFDASDLSDEKVVNTGKNTFQLAQKNYEPDAPMMAIGINQITFLNPQTGELISMYKYDGVVRITDSDELIFWENRKQKTVSLEKLMKDGEK